MEKFLVKKQFALDSDIYNKGDVLEMGEVDAKSFLENGSIEAYVEKQDVKIEVDTKGISAAIEAGFSKFAPQEVQEEKKSMNMGEFLQGISKKEIDAGPLVRKTINITTAAQGGNQTESYLSPSVDADLLRESGIAQMATSVPLDGQNNVYKFNVISSIGNAPAVVAESDPVNASQPLITNFSISLQKLMYRFDVTEEALQDTGALTAEVTQQIPSEYSKYVENGILNGAGPFTAIIGDTNTVSVAKESGQTDDTIVAENVDKMFTSAKNPSRSIWILSRSAYAAVQGLEDSAGHRIFQGPNGLGAAPFGTLKGLPIAISDYANTLGLEGDIILADMSKYKIASKGGLSMMSSEHVSFLEDETVFKFRYRAGGLPYGLKLTATDGTSIGDFVTLADRGSL
jgi:HK97 family phage major capsid protein